MSCCGSRRAAQTRSTGLRAARPSPRPLATAPAPAPHPVDGVALEYTGPVPMVLPSPSGGAAYSLQAERQRLTVPPADAEVLRRTGWFTTPAAEGAG